MRKRNLQIIDQSIRFRLGLFDPKEQVKFAQIPLSVLESPEHQEHALKMAHQSIVLLKNEKQTLPLSKKLRKIAVLGPNADDSVTVLGNYNGHPSKLSTPLQAIKEKLGSGTEVFYDKAVDFTATLTGKPDLKAIADEVKDADAIIFVGGISPKLEGEEMKVNQPGFNGGDRTSIALPEVQTNLLKALKATGKPVIFVMMTGSALAIPWEAENIPAIVNAWYGGQAAGTALADVLFGDYNPAGRLPVTFYKSDQDLPSFTDYSMNNRTYRYFKSQPLYAFGYGLSYTTFKYGELQVPYQIPAGKNTIVSVKVTNTGKMDGEEVVQLYLSHLKTQTDAPIRALKGFKRIFLKAGESRNVSFTLTIPDLSLIDEQGTLKELPGSVMVSIGGSQPDAKTQVSKKTVGRVMRVI